MTEWLEVDVSVLTEKSQTYRVFISRTEYDEWMRESGDDPSKPLDRYDLEEFIGMDPDWAEFVFEGKLVDEFVWENRINEVKPVNEED